MRFKRKTKQQAPSPSDSEGVMISDVFYYELRNPQGKLIAAQGKTNKTLKTKNHIKEWLKRLLKIA